ncbi:unnamed protein product [Trifolium pratense]|uniref:Uncharacterized protein n=1 Tax=Trifolium pratense TaxID=57577 RepID=A0ACB0J7E9_TRIPR|nr:unnamed protein product [Trifolium pratense]
MLSEEGVASGGAPAGDGGGGNLSFSSSIQLSQSPSAIIDAPKRSSAGNPDEIVKLLPFLFQQLSASLVPADSSKSLPLSGGQAPGGHNVIYGIYGDCYRQYGKGLGSVPFSHKSIAKRGLVRGIHQHSVCAVSVQKLCCYNQINTPYAAKLSRSL